MVGKDLPAQRIHQERRPPVQGGATHRLHQAAQQPQRQWRLEQHRRLAGTQLARTQPRKRTFRCIPAQRRGIGQIGRSACRRIPAIALHVRAPAGNRPHRQGMPAVRKPPGEPAGVGRQKVSVPHRHGSTVAVGNAGAYGKAGRLDLPGQLDGLIHRNMPGREQLQPRHIMLTQRQEFLLGQPRVRIFTGDGSDVIGGLHRAGHGLRTEIAGAGMPAPLAHMDGNAQPLVAGLLDGLDLALAHRHGQPRRLRHLGHGRRGPQPPRQAQGIAHQLLEIGPGVVEERPVVRRFSLQVPGRQVPGPGFRRGCRAGSGRGAGGSRRGFGSSFAHRDGAGIRKSAWQEPENPMAGTETHAEGIGTHATGNGNPASII